VRPRNSLILRSGLLVGPFDPSDRFTYWAVRMREPGPVLAPAVPTQPVQFIDARDFAEWTMAAAERAVTGVMNVNGPRGSWTFGELLKAAGDAEIRWVDESVLLDAGVQPWMELPLWLPDTFAALGMLDMDVDRAEAAGLTTRPVAETLRDTVAWAADRTAGFAADYGTRATSKVMTRKRETELLTALPGG
jgi:2'-hydroxyisoflavone reductase